MGVYWYIIARCHLARAAEISHIRRPPPLGPVLWACSKIAVCSGFFWVCSCSLADRLQNVTQGFFFHTPPSAPVEYDKTSVLAQNRPADMPSYVRVLPIPKVCSKPGRAVSRRV